MLVVNSCVLAQDRLPEPGLKFRDREKFWIINYQINLFAQLLSKLRDFFFT